MTDEYPNTHPVEKIINSEVFKAINLLIDQHYGELIRTQAVIKKRMEHLLRERPHGMRVEISTRVSYERGSITRPEDHKELLFSLPELRELGDFIRRVEREEEAIHSLMRYKLRLLNDYDFTHGDPSEQFSVFGRPEDDQG